MLMKLEEKKKHVYMKVREAPEFQMLLAEEVNTPVPSSIPVLRKESCLMWYPVLRKVALSPIKEEEEPHDEPDGGKRTGLFVNIWRPLFYCELDAGRYREMKKRYYTVKPKKKFKVVYRVPKMVGLGEAIEA